MNRLILVAAAAGTLGTTTARADDHHHAPPAASAPALAAVTDVALPARGAEGKPVDPTPLHANPHVRLAVVTLRKGAVLPPHDSKAVVTLTALVGRGTVKADGKTFALDAGHMLVLAPGVRHEVVPATADELQVLIHHVTPQAAGKP